VYGGKEHVMEIAAHIFEQQFSDGRPTSMIDPEEAVDLAYDFMTRAPRRFSQKMEAMRAEQAAKEAESVEDGATTVHEQDNDEPSSIVMP